VECSRTPEDGQGQSDAGVAPAACAARPAGAINITHSNAGHERNAFSTVVRSSWDGAPIAGATVRVDGTTLAAITDFAGRETTYAYDADYDIVAAATGQPVQWVVPRGSVP
jgi:hypothetical protein